MSCCCGKFHVWALGLALGILSAICMFLLGLFAISGYGTSYVTTIGSVYVGYGATFVGSIIGAIWGFIEGFICGVIFAWLYNCFIRKCKCVGKGKGCGCGCGCGCAVKDKETGMSEKTL